MSEEDFINPNELDEEAEFSIAKEGVPNTTPPLSIQQSRTLRNISHLSKNSELSKRFYNALKWAAEDDLDYVDILLAFGVVRTIGQYNHIRFHWFPKLRNLEHDLKRTPPHLRLWWPYSPSQPIIQPLVYEGLTNAFELSIASGKPIDYYWIIIGESRIGIENEPALKQQRIFSRMYESEERILLQKCTPPPPGWPPEAIEERKYNE